MKTYEQELAELQARHARDIEEARIKHEILAKLPAFEGYAPPFIHHFKLYGSVGAIKYRLQRYASIAEGLSPDASVLRELLEFAPPVELIRWRDGCTSFRPEPETYLSNGGVLAVDPVLIELDPSQHGSVCTVKWYGRIGEELWRFEVEFPYHQLEIGTPQFRWNRYAGGHGDISSVDFLGFSPKPPRAKYIKWARGSRTDPGKLTVYWERGEGPSVGEIAGLLQPQTQTQKGGME